MLDLGILFHAREFPTDYRTSRYGDTYPVGHAAMGGEKDVRIGSECCTQDPDFHLRNYVWLMSLNQVFLVDPTDQSFNEEWIPCKEFHTLHEVTCSGHGHQGRALGDVNYFPFLETHQVLWCLRDSFPPTLLVLHAHQEGGLEAVNDLLKNMASSKLSQLVSSLTSPSCIFKDQVPIEIQESVLGQATELSREKKASLVTGNAVETDKMLLRGLEENFAKQLLEATASSEGIYSEFRASNLLQVVSGEHRGPELVTRFGQGDHDLTVSRACLKVAFYPESTLEALELLHAHPELGPQGAAQQVVDQKEALTRRLFEAQGISSKALREAAGVVEQLEQLVEGKLGEAGKGLYSVLDQTRECLGVLEQLSQRARAVQYATPDGSVAVDQVKAQAVEISSHVKKIAAQHLLSTKL
eukprot:TRINITY_DN4152_c0_g1_i1.p1 TRINITY_DN4152_c0_g1~~TRINITY_DN4152_c0_g1_i1.p1  ORF type:complete len:412 (-),score=86.49 TRINITY_DN4152_c0_g1_i1:271-1506(-)